MRERSEGHILNLEVLKLCFPHLCKMSAFWYCSCLGHLRGEREEVPSLERKGGVGEDGCGGDFRPMVRQNCTPISFEEGETVVWSTDS